MEQTLEVNKETTYIDSNEIHALSQFTNCFYQHLISHAPYHNNIIILCIGTDRVTGDSLGPIIGYKLKSKMQKSATIYGTLDEPVHAKNISDTISQIYSNYVNPLVIAIDACLGRMDHVGYITVSKGVIRPGAGVKKELPCVGDIAVTGIVNFSGIMDMLVLQNTRLNIVMKMADIISSGIGHSLWKYENYFFKDNFNNPLRKQMSVN